MLTEKEMWCSLCYTWSEIMKCFRRRDGLIGFSSYNTFIVREGYGYHTFVVTESYDKRKSWVDFYRSLSIIHESLLKSSYIC